MFDFSKILLISKSSVNAARKLDIYLFTKEYLVNTLWQIAWHLANAGR